MTNNTLPDSSSVKNTFQKLFINLLISLELILNLEVQIKVVNGKQIQLM